jgi:4-amino-4-deoxy-L-arabinose transferase-like glycosyltransferase
VVLALTAALATALSRPYRLVAWPMLSAMTLAALATALPWPLALGHAHWVGLADPVAALNHRAAWLARNAGQLSWPTAASWSNLLRNLPWFFWPAWPIAAWAVWQWRSQRLAAAVALPALCTAGLLMLAVFSTGASEVALLPVIAPMAMLAALGVPALRRGISSLIDWFAVMSFSLIGLALWAYWLAFMTGWPPRMAISAQRAVRGFMPILDPLEALLGLAATIAWIVLVYWRVSRQPRALWRTVALSSGGLVLTWFLLMTLWLPAANFRNTYRDVAQQAGAAIPGGYRCIRTLGLDAAHRASFAYFGAMRLDDVRPDCDWLLLAERIDSPMAIESIPGAWHEAWSGQRPADRRERFRLLKRRAQ